MVKNDKYRCVQAPLIHTVAHIEFSPLPNFDAQASNAIHRGMLDIGYPDKSDRKMVNVNIDLDSPQHNPTTTSKTRYSFRNAGARRIVQIFEDALIYKVTDYTVFPDFNSQFRQVLESFSDHCDDFNKSLLRRVSLRYSNLIIPSSGKKLDAYLKSGLLPYQFLIAQQSEGLQGVNHSRVQTGPNQALTVAFEQNFIDKDGKIKRLLPNNLMESEPNAALQLGLSEEQLEPKGISQYGIFDTDHTCLYPAVPSIDIDPIQKKMTDLNVYTSNVFYDSITEHAEMEWGKTLIKEEE